MYLGLLLSPGVQLPCGNYKMSYVIMKVPYCSNTSGISDNVITSPYKTIINHAWGTFFPIAKLSEELSHCMEWEYHGMASIMFPKPVVGDGSIKIKYLT